MSENIGQALQKAGDLLRAHPKQAFQAAQAIAREHRDCAPAYRLMAAALRRGGDIANAEKAELASVEASLSHPHLKAAAAALAENRARDAQIMLRKFLEYDPSDPVALRYMADLGARAGDIQAAETLLRRALRIAPSYAGARTDLAILLHKEDRIDEAQAELDDILRRERSDELLAMKATFLEQAGRIDQALAIQRDLLRRNWTDSRRWIAISQLLRVAGEINEAVAAVRQALVYDPESPMGWYSLADFKNVALDSRDKAAIEAALARARNDNDRSLLHIALAKAFEDLDDPEHAFAQYEAANSISRQIVAYEPEATTQYVAATRRMLTNDFFASRQGYGDPVRAPIFVLGMHRSGSSLVEQILASHPDVEGLSELGQLGRIAARLSRPKSDPHAFLKGFAAWDDEQCRQIGSEYIDRVRPYRRTRRPMFVDKMPGNWRYIALIQLCLPNAIIIDVRRDPIDCCLSNYKQKFARGQAFTYSLSDMGRYYRDYVEFMRHFDRVLPGRIYRVLHERLVTDTEREIGALLEHCSFKFDERCLRFFETDRAVRTPSTAQVRRPIDPNSLEKWRRYEPWLSPLKKALGPALEDYRD